MVPYAATWAFFFCASRRGHRVGRSELRLMMSTHKGNNYQNNQLEERADAYERQQSNFLALLVPIVDKFPSFRQVSPRLHCCHHPPLSCGMPEYVDETKDGSCNQHVRPQSSNVVQERPLPYRNSLLWLGSRVQSVLAGPPLRRRAFQMRTVKFTHLVLFRDILDQRSVNALP